MSDLKHWKVEREMTDEVWYNLAKQDRVVSLGVKGWGVTVMENCDQCFEANYSKVEAVEMLKEMIVLIEEGG